MICPSRQTLRLAGVRDAGCVLVHAHDRCIDYLHRRIMTGYLYEHRIASSELREAVAEGPILLRGLENVVCRE